MCSNGTQTTKPIRKAPSKSSTVSKYMKRSESTTRKIKWALRRQGSSHGPAKEPKLGNCNTKQRCSDLEFKCHQPYDRFQNLLRQNEIRLTKSVIPAQIHSQKKATQSTKANREAPFYSSNVNRNMTDYETTKRKNEMRGTQANIPAPILMPNICTQCPIQTEENHAGVKMSAIIWQILNVQHA